MRILDARERTSGERAARNRGGSIAVRNPATDEVIGEVPRGGAAETRRAVDAAAAAMVEWRTWPAADRRDVLHRLAVLIDRDRERLAQLLTEEQGKPIREARSEISTAAQYVRDAADEATRIVGDLIPGPTRDRRAWVLYEPVGVVGAITPWNFPAVIAARKIAPALAVGCSVVLKPASLTPLSALAMGELGTEAGLPSGVLTIVTGNSAAIADAMLSDARVRKISFTGSTEVGQRLMARAARNVTRLTLELGGLAPFLVFDDADLDAAVRGLMASKFRNGGQTCICPNMVLVQRSVMPAFLDLTTEAVVRLQVGPGELDDTDIGPLIDDRALAKVELHVADAVERGARVLAGGRRWQRPEGLSDRFYLPTVLADVDPAAKVGHEETFGPVVPFQAFDTEAEAVAIANGTRYGLAAYFYTRDAARIVRLAEGLQFGIIGANDGHPSRPGVPLGGMKASGMGREGGRWGAADYLETKLVSIGGISPR
jgi:succinate-semialdehyde dehydrogenase / glutarate-semialdehyde dehydrogenase